MEAATRRVDVKENGKMQTIHYHMLYVIYYYNMSIYSWTALHSSPLPIFQKCAFYFLRSEEMDSFTVSLGWKLLGELYLLYFTYSGIGFFRVSLLFAS